MVDEKGLENRNCVRRFKFGENVYLSKKKVKFPIVLNVEDGDYIRREVVANVVYNVEGKTLIE